MWMAGGGVKGGLRYGATDDYGYYAAENKVHVHDLHATILHLLGLNHERLTYRYGGRDFRLTDVHGEIVHGILAIYRDFLRSYFSRLIDLRVRKTDQNDEGIDG